MVMLMMNRMAFTFFVMGVAFMMISMRMVTMFNLVMVMVMIMVMMVMVMMVSMTQSFITG